MLVKTNLAPSGEAGRYMSRSHLSGLEKSRLRAGANGRGRIGSRFGGKAFGVAPLTIARDVRRKLRQGVERWIYGTRELRIYVLPFEKLALLPRPAKFNRNSIDDLLHYRRTSLSQPPRREFLKLVEQRLERGMIVYTFVERGVLRAYIWLDPEPQSYFGRGVDQEIEVVPNSVYLQDAFTDPAVRSRGVAQSGFCQAVHDAAEIPGKTSVYLAVLSWNIASRHSVEKLGGELRTSYFCKTRLGRRKTWKIDHGR